MSELTAQGDYGPLSVEDCALWLDRKYSRHGEIEDKGSAELLRALKSENERLREALRYVRRTINPIGSWVTIGEAVPMVDNAISCIDAALTPQETTK